MYGYVQRNMKIMMTLWSCKLALKSKRFVGKALFKQNLTKNMKDENKKQMTLKDINTIFIRTMNKQQ